MKKLLLLLVVALVSLCGIQRASSLTIVRIFTGGTPPTNSIGAGNLTDIVNAACDTWELAIRDEHTVTLYYGWAPVGGGQHDLLTQCGTPNRETSGSLLFNNDNDPNHLPWYLDPTPYSCSDATNYVVKTVNLGMGPINAGRNYLYPSTSDKHIDLFTIALHEVGHALGMSFGNFSFIDECTDGDIDVTQGPCAWSIIPMQTNSITGLTTSHIEYIGDCVMSGSFVPGSRMMPTAIDIIALAQLSKFTQLNLDLVPVLTMGTPYQVIHMQGKKKTVTMEAKLSWIQPLPLPPGKTCVIQTCTNLSQGTWSNLNATIVNNNGQFCAAVDVSGSQKFFRLVTQ
ncbi:MAG: hypothetical protein RLY66_499 [Candidatus Parcubacteria bacterium]|jgi:hypothetical protein